MSRAAPICSTPGSSRTGRRSSCSSRSQRPSRSGRSRRPSSSLEHPPVVTPGRRTDEDELHLPDGVEVEVVETNRGGKSTFHGPGPARLLPDPRPQPPRQGPEALRPRPRAGDHRHGRPVRPRGDGDRRAHRRLARAAAAQARLDRRARLALGDDARLRAQRRPRPGAVHRRGSRPAGSRTPSSRR